MIEVPDRDEEKLEDRRSKVNKTSDNYITNNYDE